MKIEELQEKLREALVIQPGEIYKYFCQGGYFRQNQMMKGDFQAFTIKGHRGRNYRSDTEEKYESGAMILTSKRIVWFGEKGMFNKTYYPVFQIDLKDIIGKQIIGTLSKRLMVSDGKCTYKFRVPDVDVFSSLMEEGIAVKNNFF